MAKSFVSNSFSGLLNLELIGHACSIDSRLKEKVKYQYQM